MSTGQPNRQSPDNQKVKLPVVIAAVTLAVILVPIVVFMLWAPFTRYIADDFCYAVLIPQHGVLGAQIFEYMTWSGRFTSTLSLTAIAGAGTWTAAVIATLFVGLWLVVSIWAMHQVLMKIGVESLLLSAVVGSLVLYATLDRGPLFQIALWQTGIWTYGVPLVIGTFFMGLAVRIVPHPTCSRWWLVVAAGLTFIAGAYNETYGFAQIAALVLLIAVGVYLRQVQRAQWNLAFLLAALGGAVLAFVLVGIAPGNAIRQSLFPPPPGLTGTVVAISAYTAQYIWIFFNWSRQDTFIAFIPALLVFIYPLSHVPVWSKRTVLAILAFAALSSVILVVFSLAPAAYAQSQLAPRRSLGVPSYSLEIIILLCSVVVGVALRSVVSESFRANRLVTLALGVVLALGLAIGPARSAVRAAKAIPTLQANAALWDARDMVLRQDATDGNLEVVTYSVGPREEIDDLTENPKVYPDTCVAQYYHLHSITGQ